MIQLACLLLCLIATNQTFAMLLQKEKIKDAWILIGISLLFDSIAWVLVFGWSFGK